MLQYYCKQYDRRAIDIMESIRTFFDGILDVITSFFVKILYLFNR